MAKRFYRKPADAQVFLRRLKPAIVSDRPGLVVNRLALTTSIVQRLRVTSRARIRIRHSSQPADTRQSAFRSVIVIRRGSNHLYLYQYDHLRKTFRKLGAKSRHQLDARID